MSALSATARRGAIGSLRSGRAGVARVVDSFAAPHVQIRSFITVKDGQVIRDHLPPARGLYDPKLEKDSCGVG